MKTCKVQLRRFDLRIGHVENNAGYTNPQTLSNLVNSSSFQELKIDKSWNNTSIFVKVFHKKKMNEIKFPI